MAIGPASGSVWDDAHILAHDPGPPRCAKMGVTEVTMTRTVFRGGRVFDGTATLASADVVVEDGRIVDVGPGLGGEEEVQLDERAVLPGLFDCHTPLMIGPLAPL